MGALQVTSRADRRIGSGILGILVKILGCKSGRGFGRGLIRPRCFGQSTKDKFPRKMTGYYSLESGGHPTFPSLNLRVVGSTPTRLTIFPRKSIILRI